MQAAVYKTYGRPEVLRIEALAAPVIQPEHADRVLVRVRAAGLNPFDYLHRQGFLPVRLTNGFFTPRQPVLGIDVAGEVLAIGPAVTRFKPGERVFGSCLGSHAEVVRVRERTLSLTPRDLTDEAAAALPCAAQTAWQGLRDVARLQPGQRVLINGASGGIGHFAVQLARVLGARVTAVCSSANQEWVRALGADEMIDYTRTDFTRSGQRYEVIYDTVGKRTYWDCRRALTPGGVYLTENPLKSGAMAAQWIWGLLNKDARLKTHLTEPDHRDLDYLAGLVEAGQLRPVIDRVYPLAQIAEAHRHLEAGHARGKIVVAVQPA